MYFLNYRDKKLNSDCVKELGSGLSFVTNIAALTLNLGFFQMIVRNNI